VPSIFGLIGHDGAGFHDSTHIVNGYVDVRQRIAFDGNHVCKNSREPPAPRANVAGRATPVSEV
jgi:hypothetical protein